jgi:ADP-ribose pyrophosphatase YjhB (NUDIX family)
VTQAHWQDPPVAVMGFVEEGEDLLLLQRAAEPLRRQWGLPGGFVEAGEHPADALCEAVLEQTGLEVTPRRLIGVYPSLDAETGDATLDFAYLCRIRGGQFELSADSMDARWYPLDEFPDPALPSEQAALEDLRRKLG